MKTLIFIHGADSFDSKDIYREWLKGQYMLRNIEPWKDVESPNWRLPIAREWIKQGGTVYMPMMPNKQNAKYHDWKILFEAILERLNPKDEITFVGVSLGGCFLLKYFSEIEKFHFKINQIHLVAACISEGDFTAPENYEALKNLGDRVHIWHAEEDPVVPFATAKILEKEIPHAQTHLFSPEKGYGHFHGIPAFPELEEILS